MRPILRKLILLPCSKIYGMAMYLRNKCFDWHILKQRTFSVPIITVGNLAVGGTGKTPHVEYIVGAFYKKMKVAVMSRGYKRHTKGFIVAGPTSTVYDIGDEAYQVYHKFNSEVTVVVCEDRVVGIEELMRIRPDIRLIVLDDAFQHRYVKPTISVLMSEYRHPLYEDKLLPYGHLREGKRGVNRADIVVVSKCPGSMKPYDFRQCINDYDLLPWQRLYFSHYEYRPLKPVFPDVTTTIPYLEWLTEEDAILIVAGIGNPRPFLRRVRSSDARAKVNIYPDHHCFTKKDIKDIQLRFDSLRRTGRRMIITTEKDAVRLAASPYFPYELKAHTFYLPIEVEFDCYDSSMPDIISVLDEAVRKHTADSTSNA